ncbi:MAG: glycosyltransferase family 2 protein [Flavobacteriales bacterium]|nr:glycosyltransferase family 2 protein [Flavobacteriales bacterium]
MPSVSIIIPCKNEAAYIENCIRSVFACEYPNELLSVYVCDGKSTDGTPKIVKELAKEYSNLHLLINEQQTAPFGLNLGLRTSRADIKIILGAHSTVHPDFIAENVTTFELDPAIGCAGGIIINQYENEVSNIIGAAMSSPFGVGNAHFRTASKDGYVDTVAFGAYKKEVFEKAGYFDENLTRNQDDEFNYRIHRHGYKIYLNRQIKSNYFVRASYGKLFRQYFQYGYWKVFVNKKHKMITTLRQVVPMLFVLFLIIGLPLSFVHPLFTGFYLGILSLYFIGALIAATQQKANPLLLIYCFLILHISYGLGYLNGILDFMLLNKNPSDKAGQSSR